MADAYVPDIMESNDAIAGFAPRLPAASELWYYLRLSLPVNALFFSVYGLCNWLTAARTQRYRLYFDSELEIPFVPGMIFGYFSLLVLFCLPIFLVPARDWPVLAKRMTLGILTAAVGYLLLPAQLGFERQPSVPGYEWIYSLVYHIDLPHNLVPSLHIVFSSLTVLALWRHAAGWGRAAYIAWLGLICVSVVLVHQHHVADVLTGLMLAALCARLVPHGAQRGMALSSDSQYARTGGKS
jgi:membrane-associated phospholipid phosphatase